MQKLKGSIHNHATMKNQDDTFCLEAKSTSMKSRDKKKLAATFHQAGMNFQNFLTNVWFMSERRMTNLVFNICFDFFSQHEKQI